MTNECGSLVEVRTKGIDVDVSLENDTVKVKAQEAKSLSRTIELRCCFDEGAVAEASAALIVETLRAAIDERGRAVWIPSTGRTVIGCYAVLVAKYRFALDWNRVEVFQMDELADVPEEAHVAPLPSPPFGRAFRYWAMRAHARCVVRHARARASPARRGRTRSGRSWNR